MDDYSHILFNKTPLQLRQKRAILPLKAFSLVTTFTG